MYILLNLFPALSEVEASFARRCSGDVMSRSTSFRGTDDVTPRQSLGAVSRNSSDVTPRNSNDVASRNSNDFMSRNSNDFMSRNSNDFMSGGSNSDRLSGSTSNASSTGTGVTVVNRQTFLDINNLTYSNTDFGAIPKFVDKSKVDFGAQGYEFDESFKSDVDSKRLLEEAEKEFCAGDKFATNESFSSCVANDDHVRILNWKNVLL